MRINKMIIVGQLWINLPMLIFAFFYAAAILKDTVFPYLTTTIIYIVVSVLYWACMSPKYQLFAAKNLDTLREFKKFKVLANKSCLLCDKNFFKDIEIWSRKDKDFLKQKFQ